MYNTSSSWKEQIYTNKQCIMNVYFDNVLINSDYILDFKKGGEIFDEELSLEIATSQYIELKILKDQIATMPEVIRVEFGILLNNNSNSTEIIPIGIYNLESYTDNDDGTFTIKALDNMIKFEFNYDGSTLVNTNGSATLLQVVQDICNQAGVELGSTSFLNSDKQIAVYDNSVSAREYIKYIAESSGGFACIGRDGKLYFKDIYQDTVQISIDMFGAYKWSEEFKISKVHYEDGVRNFTFGDSTRNTLYINQNNMFIVSQAQVQNIYNKVKNLTINSFEGQTIIDPAIDLGDKIIIDGKPVVFQGEIALAGSFIADIKCNIQTKQKEETTVITPSQVAINRRVQGQIDQVEGSITQVVEERVNNIQIGGTNILRGTDVVTALTSSGTWANGTWRSATSGNGTRERIDIIDSPNGNIKKGWRFTRTAESNNGSTDIAQDYVPVTNGQTYTMSCWARCVSGNVRLRLQYGKNPWRNNAHPNITDTNWKRYSYTFTVGEQSDGSTNGNTMVYFGLFPYSDNSAGVLEICGLKLESGNKATDWSPAPEDIESNLQNNYYTKTETESKIEQKADSITSTVSQNYSTKAETTQAKNEAINSANTSTDNKLANYSTTTQMNSAITQKANEITTTVTTLENKVNNMQVGGRNYLKNSKTTTTLTKPASSYAQYNWDSYHPLATKTLSTPLICTLSFRFIPTDENYRPCTSIVVGKNANGDIWSKRIYYSDLKVKKYSDYYFYYASFTIPATEGAYIQSFIKFILSSSDSANLGGQVSHLKLEDGNMPTDWTPAPEDIDSNLTTNYYTKTETNSQITQKADEISSVVSQSISAVQVGGTNLVKNSAPYSLDGWTSYGATTSLADESGAPFNKSVKLSFADTSATGAFKSIENRLEVGKEYSWSVYIKASKSTELTVGQEQGGTKVVNLTTSWQKFTHTFTADNEPHNNFIFYCYSDARQNGLDVYIHSLKLEEGNKITSWSVNPNDEVTEYNVISKINQSAEAVQINANKISLVGKQIDLTGEDVTITSDNFSVNKYGEVIITGGTSYDNANFKVTDTSNQYTSIIPGIVSCVNSNGSKQGIMWYDHLSFDILYNDGICEPIYIGIDENGYSPIITLAEPDGSMTTINGSEITTPIVYQTSLESKKKNIKKADTALDIVKNAEIYKYNFNFEEDTDKKHYGFVIPDLGGDYKTPSEVINQENSAIEQYSMTSILWKAVQEQQEIIEGLKSRIEKLEKKVNK